MAVGEESARRADTRGVRPAWLRPGNRLVIGLQRAGIALGPMHLLTVPGRKTGKPRTTPVSVVVVGGVRYLVQAFPRASWVANARAAGAGVLARGRTRSDIRLTLVPVADRPAILRELSAVVEGGAGLFVRTGMVTSPDPAGFAAAAPRIAVFRIDDVRQAGSQQGSQGRALPVVIQLWLAVLTLAATVTEFALAGLGAFRGADAAQAQDSFYDPHRALGFAISGLVIVLAVTVILGRTGRRAAVTAALLAILGAVVQPLLAQAGGTHAWVGSLHAVNGLLILGLTAALARAARADRAGSRR